MIRESRNADSFDRAQSAHDNQTPPGFYDPDPDEVGPDYINDDDEPEEVDPEFIRELRDEWRQERLREERESWKEGGS